MAARLKTTPRTALQLSRLAPETARQISEYQRIISFRHVLVHGYAALNHELVWHVIEHKLPGLLGEIQALLGEDHDAPGSG